MTMNRVIVVAFGGLLVLSACGGGSTTVLPVTEPPVEPEIEVAPEITDQDSEEAARLAAEEAARLAAEEARLAAEEAARLAAEEAAQNLRPDVLPALPLQQVHHAHQAPIVDLDGTLHVGAGVAPPAHILEGPLHYRGIRTNFGLQRDGIDRDRLIAYLREDVLSDQNGTPGRLQHFGTYPPSVRLAEGTTAAQTAAAVRAVQIINAALPPFWRLDCQTAFNTDPRSACKIDPP